MTTTAATPGVTVAVWPGCEPRLLISGIEDGATYRAGGGYRELPDAEGFLAEVHRSGLLGRGGAAFPLAVKLTSVRESVARRGLDAVVVANGEEGEPASIKDRWLLRNRPHLVLDGLRLAAATAGATSAYVYVSDPAAARSVETALGETGAETLGLTISVYTVGPGYVAGEETAAVRAINGGPAKPTDKPPRPYRKGVAQRPTLVSNVETLANLPYLARHGAERFRSVGTASSPGTFLATVSGGGRPPALYEIPHGVVLADLLGLHGIPSDQVRGVLMGGYFAGLCNPDVLAATLDHETLRAGGSGLGCGAMSVLTDDCPVAVAASVLAYFGRENAGQCGSCFNGTVAMAAVAEALRDQVATAADVERLQRWAGVLPGRGACGTLDGATNVAASFLTRFPELVAAHLAGGCDTCREGAFRAERPYAIEEVPA